MKILLLALLLSPMLLFGVTMFTPVNPLIMRQLGYQRYVPIGKASCDYGYDKPVQELIVLDRWTNKLCIVDQRGARPLKDSLGR